MHRDGGRTSLGRTVVDHHDRSTVDGCRGRFPRGVRQQDAGTGLGQHEPHPVGRRAHVERHVGAAGLHDGQDGDHEVGRAFNQDADAVLDPHAERHQPVGQRVGPLVQLGVGVLDAVGDERRGSRAAPDLLGEQARHRTGRDLGGGVVERRQNPVALGRGQDVDRVQPDGGIGGDRGEHAAEVAGEPLDRRGVEEPAVVLDGTGQSGEPHGEVGDRRRGGASTHRRHARHIPTEVEFGDHVLERHDGVRAGVGHRGVDRAQKVHKGQ